MDYLRFIRDNRRFLGFGFLLAALSGYGQTYLISLFGGEIRADLGLTNGQFGGIYSTATLISGVSLIGIGRLLDRVDLRLFTVMVLLGAAFGCALMAGAVGVFSLGLGLVLMRLCGQGLMMHAAQTSMARYFHARRGTAISVATLGLPAGEALFPSLVVTLVAVLGWRQSWLAMGVVLVVAVVPLSLWLLRGHTCRQQAHEAGDAPEATPGRHGRHWSRREMLTDPRFYGVLPAVMAPPFIVTALFIHQVPLAAEKGWPLAWLASSFIAFGATHVVSLLVAGPLVDRIGGQRLLPFYLGPLAGALAVLIAFDGVWAAPGYLGMAGLSLGVGGTLLGALWVELYGTRNLGAIRALIQAIMVISTAIAPGAVGWLLDADFAMTEIVGGLLAWIVIASVIAAVAVRGASR